MRILDILILTEELVQTQQQQASYNGNLRPGRPHDGNGTQAKVTPDRNDPHMVRKHNYNPYVKDRSSMQATFQTRKEDGFNRFVQFLIKHKHMGENPHLPRVYNIKTITDAEGRHINTYTVEKLTESSEITWEELEAFIEGNLHEGSIWMDEDRRGTQGWVWNTFQTVAQTLDRAISLDTVRDKVVKSETLIEAIDILRKAKRVLGEPTDMHAENYMWRRGPQGMTLVFNDPFY